MLSGKLLLCLRAHSRFSVLLRAAMAPKVIPRGGGYAEDEPARDDRGGTRKKESARRRQPRRTGGDDYYAHAYTDNITIESTFEGESGESSKSGFFVVIALQGA